MNEILIIIVQGFGDVSIAGGIAKRASYFRVVPSLCPNGVASSSMDNVNH